MESRCGKFGGKFWYWGTRRGLQYTQGQLGQLNESLHHLLVPGSTSLNENPYWQIPDEYYIYQNTSRQANWRPSSLPLTFNVRYENVVQDENVERWEWQPSDLDAQDEDEDVTTFYAAGAEVALPEVRRIRNGQSHYGIQLSRSMLDLHRGGEQQKKTDVITYGKFSVKKQHPLARGAYGSWRMTSTVKARDRKMAAGVAWGGTGSHSQSSTAYYEPANSLVPGRGRLEYGSTRSVLVSKSADDVLSTYQKCGDVLPHRSWSQVMHSFDEDASEAFVRFLTGRRHSI
uniref:Uncharacterized protein n=1 Tax=Branchiostoma floridae TaxID=7739 RepID=C3ZQN6_BRAFL|eukprot:XP_002589071.1 hypothetical protein BRAFLDRAFT_75051 [Branchiostoma floridae]